LQDFFRLVSILQDVKDQTKEQTAVRVIQRRQCVRLASADPIEEGDIGADLISARANRQGRDLSVLGQSKSPAGP
jgi:hypothetical protein